VVPDVISVTMVGLPVSSLTDEPTLAGAGSGLWCLHVPLVAGDEAVESPRVDLTAVAEARRVDACALSCNVSTAVSNTSFVMLVSVSSGQRGATRNDTDGKRFALQLLASVVAQASIVNAAANA
jgi:hypothetical protein